MLDTTGPGCWAYAAGGQEACLEGCGQLYSIHCQACNRVAGAALHAVAGCCGMAHKHISALYVVRQLLTHRLANDRLEMMEQVAATRWLPIVLFASLHTTRVRCALLFLPHVHGGTCKALQPV